MKRTGVLLAFLALVLMVSCSRQNSIKPTAPEVVSTETGLRTFVLSSADDARLPAPGVEDADASPAERAAFENLSTASYGRPSGGPKYNNPPVFWNDVTTELGRKAGLPPPLFARAYALVQVAIYDALVVGHDLRRGGLKEEAVAAGAASEVLLYLFPNDRARIQDAVTSQFGVHRPRGVFARAWFLGQTVGKLVVDYGKKDGSDAVFTGTPPSGDCIWTGVNPVLPLCGTWKTWVIASGDEIQPEPPYACGSPEDLADVEAVYQASFVRTPEQIAIVHKWADLPPPTVWNGYLNQRLLAGRWSTLSSARAHAYLNVTMYDAFVCCWRTKFITYTWVARPFQRLAGRSPAFTTVITTPNFPTYTSGHSTISGAAGVVMGELFPSEAAFFEAQAEEAAISRFYGGIHFHHDDDAGLVVGNEIGTKAVARMHSDGGGPILATP